MADDTTTPPATPPAAPVAPETFSREYVTDLRNEAAAARVKANNVAAETRATVEAEFAVKEQAFNTEITRLNDLVGQGWIGAEKVTAALAVLFPEEQVARVSALAGMLTGVDAASIKDSAANAKTLLGIDPTATSTPVRATDPTQGAGSGQPPLALNSDGLLTAITKMVGATPTK